MDDLPPQSNRPLATVPVETTQIEPTKCPEDAESAAAAREQLTVCYLPSELAAPILVNPPALERQSAIAAQPPIPCVARTGVAIDPEEIIGCLHSVELSTNLQQLLHGGNGRPADENDTETCPENAGEPRPFRARYLIGREIGHGGMGIVYRGWDLQLERRVAIKIIREDRKGNRQHLLRFLREARIASRLRHPGILAIHDFDVEPSGSAYIIMDLISEKNLEQVIAESIDDVSRRQSMLTTFLQICQAIAFAHSNGVVHRDLKPANIMVGAYRTATVLDWGLAKVLGKSVIQATDILEAPPHPIAQSTHQERPTNEGSVVETQCGVILGTLQYLAPEQARGEDVDYRADVFSLGGILCHLLTGSPPFVANTFKELYEKCVAGDVSEAFDRLNQSGAPLSVLSLAKRCLAPKAENRPSDASVLVECLTQFLDSGQRQAEEELVRFFDLSLDLFCIANTHGYFWRLNENFQRSLGYSLQELTSRPFIEFVHPDDRPATLSEIEKLARGQPAIQFINRYRHKDGHYVFLEWTARSIAQEGIIYAVARDISDRFRLQEEKRRADEDCFRLSEIVDSANDAIIGESLEAVIQTWNSGAESLFGYTRDEMIGQSIAKLLPRERLDEEMKVIDMLRKGLRVDPFATERVHKSGKCISVSVSVSAVRDLSGKLVGASKIVRSTLHMQPHQELT